MIEPDWRWAAGLGGVSGFVVGLFARFAEIQYLKAQTVELTAQAMTRRQDAYDAFCAADKQAGNAMRALHAVLTTEPLDLARAKQLRADAVSAFVNDRVRAFIRYIECKVLECRHDRLILRDIFDSEVLDELSQWVEFLEGFNLPYFLDLLQVTPVYITNRAMQQLRSLVQHLEPTEHAVYHAKLRESMNRILSAGQLPLPT